MRYPLCVLEPSYSLYRVLSANVNLSEIFDDSEFPVFIIKDGKEISLLCQTGTLSKFEKEEAGWKAIKILGEIPFNEYGILQSLLTPLAINKIGILAMSTYSTDFVFVKDENLAKALTCLKESGCTFVDLPSIAH